MLSVFGHYTKMFHIFMSVFLCYLVGVVGVEEVKSVSVMEGDSVTLHTHLQILKDEVTEWTFNNTRIAKVTGNNPTYNKDERFTNRLKLDHQTGSLTITNTRTTDSGIYTFTTIIYKKQPTKRFSVNVYAPLPIPVITSYISECSSSSRKSSSPKHLLLCTVVNVNRATLSWYKGNSVLSSISVSDLSISLSLHVEVENQDNNTYSCVVNNTFTNHTTHHCITDLCFMSSDEVPYNYYGSTEVLLRLVVTALMGLAAVAAFIVLVYDIKSRRAEQERL
ncbi:uncharacterized protein isoform X3 [Danio rerio]|uniref:Uncharacterized protein isoform X3 n=1 Tax=Danio rerio TaxID=7955 RepID=A0AB19B841_DANRE|nr:transmembrane and immunoglobulin domain-containing protein 1-like [Danio rerio]|eukprot:XP_017208772.2 transmembrane and immunoglobulin domain-containing protein 1-like [Danio rerio]